MSSESARSAGVRFRVGGPHDEACCDWHARQSSSSAAPLRIYHYLQLAPDPAGRPSVAQLREMCDSTAADAVEIWVGATAWSAPKAKANHCFTRRYRVAAWDKHVQAFHLACGSFMDLQRDQLWWPVPLESEASDPAPLCLLPEDDDTRRSRRREIEYDEWADDGCSTEFDLGAPQKRASP
jgi:hypothetical protein